MINKLVTAWLTLLSFTVIKAAQVKEKNPFLAAIKSPHYVDKTGFIEYFNDAFVSPIFFTAPSGFGKTTNLLMLKAFYEINTSENGTILKKEETENYKIFQRVRNITSARAALTLIDDEKFFNSNFGSLPVIHLSFKSILLDPFEVFIDSLKQLMIQAFKTHPYLKVSEKLTPEEKTLFGKFYNAVVRGDKHIENSGGTLAKLLSKHFGKPCLLLIDDFDAPVIKLFTNGSADEAYVMKRWTNFINDLFSDEKAVNRIFLTGKTRLAEIYTPPGVKHYQFGLHAGLTKFFGVKGPEVRGLTRNIWVLFQLNAFYKGFTVPNTTYCIFDPVTVTEFLEGRNHTRILDSVEFLRQVLHFKEVRDKIELAVRLDSFSITAPKETNHEKCVVTLRRILQLGGSDPELEMCEADWNCLFYYLFELGYFRVSTMKGSNLTLDLPDVAAHDSLGALLERYWLNHLHTTKVIASDYVEAFMSLTYKNSTLDTFANKVAMVFKESPHRPISEADLRSPLLTFLATRMHKYPTLQLNCSENSSEGYTDLQAVTKRKDHSVKRIALEFMYNNCNKEKFAKFVKTKPYWEQFSPVKKDQEQLRCLIIGICLSEKDEFEFTFVYHSQKRDNAYKTFKKIKTWKSKKSYT
nr:PREDICTED: uncharacterized protein LOC109036425 [Bemisia tabaci]